MATNTFHAGLTPIAIAREALMILQNNLVFSSLIYRDVQGEFTGAKRGDTIYIRGPASFSVNEFTSSITVQNITETNVAIQLEKHFDISVEVTAQQRTLDLESYSAQVLQPQMVAMAQAIDAYAMTKTIELNQFTGTAGTPFADWAKVTEANQRAGEAMIPTDSRAAVVNPEAEAALWALSQFHAANVRGDGGTALERASMGRVLGTDWYMSQNVPAHTAGDLGGTPTASGTAGDTSVTIAAGGASGTALTGDLVTIADDDTQYVVTADCTLNGTGDGTLAIYPALAQTAATKGVTQIADHDRNVLFHPNCFALACVPLALPTGAADAQYVQSRGVGLRMVSGYDMDSKKDVISLDVLVGAKCIQPALGVRILG